MLDLEHSLYATEHVIFQNLIRYTWHVLKFEGVEEWVDCARNEGLHRSNEESDILQTVKSGEIYWIGHILSRKRVLNQFIAGKIQGRVD